MLTGRSKHDIIDASYNRYNFHDQDLPVWFEADERKHMRAPKQVRSTVLVKTWNSQLLEREESS
jgi:hypothetical protein